LMLLILQKLLADKGLCYIRCYKMCYKTVLEQHEIRAEHPRKVDRPNGGPR
jgi:hypothetical protein